MKKSNLFLMFLMALIVMSCSKDETTMSIPQESNAIEFGTYAGRTPQTRGAEMNIAKLKDDSFGVLAYYTGQKQWELVEDDDNSNAKTTAYPNFMYNQKIVGSSTGEGDNLTYTWSYSPIKYWPTTQGDKVSFFAYAPYNVKTATDGENNYGIVLSGNTTTDKGNPSITFTLQDNPQDMVDLVTASVMDVVGTGTPSSVNFTFQHALSRVNFFAKASQLLLDKDAAGKNRTIINITGVKLDGITGGQFYESGKYTLSSTAGAKGVWTNLNPFTAEEGYDIAGILDKTTPVKHGEYSKDGVKLDGETAESLFTENQYLFLIPITGGLEADKVKVTFTYDIVTIDENLSPKYSITTATKTVSLPAETLQQGVAYNYTFTFNVDQVVVSAKVTPWGDEVVIPQNDDKLDVDYTHDK